MAILQHNSVNSFFHFTYFVLFLFYYYIVYYSTFRGSKNRGSLDPVHEWGPWIQSINGVHGTSPFFDGPDPWTWSQRGSVDQGSMFCPLAKSLVSQKSYKLPSSRTTKICLMFPCYFVLVSHISNNQTSRKIMNWLDRIHWS